MIFNTLCNERGRSQCVSNAGLYVSKAYILKTLWKDMSTFDNSIGLDWSCVGNGMW